MPILESRKEDPKCIIGFTEFAVRRAVDPDKFSFSVPYPLFRTMDENAEKSLLAKGRWNMTQDEKEKMEHDPG